MPEQLPLPILDYPHWRINLRPETHEPNRIPSVSECFKAVEKTRVRLRGWEFPYLSNDHRERSTDNDYIASWISIGEHMQYWRLYQSGQFLFLSTVREQRDQEWYSEIKRISASQILKPHDKFDWNSVPGFFDYLNFVYIITEVFEFSARMCQHGIYSGDVSHRIDLKQIRDFVLTTSEPRRVWPYYWSATADDLGHEWIVNSTSLVADSAAAAREAIVWFFQRLGWEEPYVEQIKKDQDSFLSSRRRLH